MSDIKTAKELYRKICSIGGYNLGPFLLLDDSERQKADKLRPLTGKILSEIEISGERLFRAPSPWHAALLLMTYNEYLSSLDEQPMKDKSETVIATYKQRPIFRGQGDSKWNLIAKKDRPNIDKCFEARALEAFCSLLARLFKSADLPTPPQQAFIATGQHYGLATNLLDFTADPSVAVYFATQGHKTREDQEAIVFLLPLINALNNGAKIILPPPFVKRLYGQRGVFVELPRKKATSLRNLSLEIRFPLDPSFQVIRKNKIINLLPGDLWLKRAIQWAMKWAKAGKDFPTNPEAAEPIYYAACQEIGYPEYLSRAHATVQIASWVDFISDILYWFAIHIHDGKEWINYTVIDAIVRDNFVLMEIVADLFEADAVILEKQGQSDLASGRRLYAQTFRESLKKIHSDK